MKKLESATIGRNVKKIHKGVFLECKSLKKIRILIDSCSAELFLNDGAATFTTHVYPTAGEHFYTLTGPGAAGAVVTIREILPSVKDDFVV